ncbi:hypothetical protein FVE85_6082 [Porphyridium purpureum]|uniref:Uncharacterized protein n=1 Tax=Porphyridium purpureum TaxID=35688 RepID=A0A5J4Z735_PORPP|nr:hypothetical protein FVE85_6082 [Porphyridium purpureum]|eukprot:POR6554..scf295_1
MSGLDEDRERRRLAWSATQAHILTGGGRLSRYYTRERFRVDELPHYYLLRDGAIHDVISAWLHDEQRMKKTSVQTKHVLNGAWRRTEFRGGDYVDTDTDVFNVQAGHLFVDLRFPADRASFGTHAKRLEDLSARELRILARQHCFAGYGIFTRQDTSGRKEAMNVCTRHHAIDWNYHPQFPRQLPNKWRFVLGPDHGVQETQSANDVCGVPGATFLSFEEYSVINDFLGRPLYFESWSRYPRDSNGARVLALRRIRRTQGGSDAAAYLCISGVHFAYAIDERSYSRLAVKGAVAGGCANLVDAAYRDDDIQLMRDLLRIEGSYGRVDKDWTILKSTYPWREGEKLLCRDRDQIALVMGDLSTPPTNQPCLVWNDVKWAVLENTFPEAELVTLFAMFTNQARL